MFSDIYAQEWSKVNDILSKPAPEDIDFNDIKYQHSASLSASLLTLKPECSDTLFQKIVKIAKSKKESLYSNHIFPIVPLYVTSICNESCQYCNYRVSNQIQIERLRLDDKELIHEAEYLIHEKGFNSIELVYSTDPFFRVDSICRHIELIKKSFQSVGGGLVGLNAEAFDENEYGLLKSAGLDFIVLWQETYNKDVYKQIHPGNTKKSKFKYRLNAYERMLSAGFEQIGMGVLSGLADWRHDWAMLLMHQEYLRKAYNMKSPIVGIPRLKSSEGAIIKTTTHIPSDNEFLLCVATQSIFDPHSLPFVNTTTSF